MTNREKYKFDYFTIDHYGELVKMARDLGFIFILHKDDYVADRKDIIWRHDVEFSPAQALKMAKIEHDLGVKTTYFFQTHSENYNIYEKYFSDILQEIRALGHHIGLHFDSHYWDVSDEESLERCIAVDTDYFNKVFDINIDTFSFHNTTSFVLSCEGYRYGGLINTYARLFKEKYQYCADSTGYWRYEVLDEVLCDPNTRHLQVLIHDSMWSDTVMSPRKRVMTAIQKEAERVKKFYDDDLVAFGAKNIDDDVVL
ncbi:hypothetical protein SAMN04487900_12424 [Prevotella communis]|uniref:Polysaccharide deacetylase n=1 Tax=Prevotella communis TaxID=2913614 RepID=A0A1H0K9L1_9BACT|nr:hypothetical protein [Prevotella communis]SDO52645.1 hypothetical protein SAMN04487900_12424 [Prevotella communis]